MVYLDDFDFVCISLDFRQDRRDRVQQIFQKLGILDRMKWWIVSKHPQGGMYGCFESHYSIWASPEFTRRYLCIFEDDLHETPHMVDRFNQSLEFVETYMPRYYDMIYLEPKLGYHQKHIYGDFFEGAFVNLGCYISTRANLPNILDKLSHRYGIDVDVALYKTCRAVGVFPQVFVQDCNDSNNDGGYRKFGINARFMAGIWNDILKLSPLVGLITMEVSLFGSNYLKSNEPIEFKDRRVGQ